MPVDALYSIAKSKNVKLNDAVVKAVAATLSSLPERKIISAFPLGLINRLLVTSNQDQISVARVTTFGTFGSTISKASTVKAAKISDSFKKINAVSEIPSGSFTYVHFRDLVVLTDPMQHL